jgi:hypothetical protein
MFLFHGVHPIKISVPALVLTLLFSALAGSLLVDVAKADPIIDMGIVPPKPSTTPPEIAISNPQNSTTQKTSSVLVAFTIAPPRGPSLSHCNLITVYYSASWWGGVVHVFQDQPHRYILEFSDSFEVKDVPQGVNSIVVTAVYYGDYYPYTTSRTYAEFTISGSSTVTFAVDLFPLRIGIQSPYPQAYATSDVALTFTTSEETSRLQYCLDDKGNVTITGNTTLSGLTAGSHNVTVYGWDKFGNPGASETISFTVTQAEPSSIVAISVAVIASAAAVSFGLVAYFLRRKKKGDFK